MRIAVTGGNGDLGRRLVPFLVEQGHAVVSMDRMLPAGPRQAREMIVDTRNFGEVVAAIQGCEGVIHLAAYRSPNNQPDPVVYNENTAGSYNVLSAAAALGIKRVCLASSINAIGGVFSRQPRYDYFPVDEQHPTYAEDPYSLSKWVLEQQADAFARRYDWLSIASLRFHSLVDDRERAIEYATRGPVGAIKHLWAYTLMAEACRACLLSLTAEFTGHAALYITAPRTLSPEPSAELARRHYPNTPVRGELPDHTSFFNCAKAERVLGWRHMD